MKKIGLLSIFLGLFLVTTNVPAAAEAESAPTETQEVSAQDQAQDEQKEKAEETEDKNGQQAQNQAETAEKEFRADMKKLSDAFIEKIKALEDKK